MTVPTITPVELPRYEIAGQSRAPVIVALGGISAHRHVCAHAIDQRPGWWEGVAGRGCALDPARCRVLSFDYLDGGCRTDGRPERIVTTHDQANALAAILDDAGVSRLHAIVGASYGGMVALAFAERFPERVDRLVVISAAHQPHPLATALRSVQRRIVELGLDTGRVREALAIARSLAMISYRTGREFAQRFGCTPVDRGANSATFSVEEYLRHHGRRFAAEWSAARFLALSLSGDLHRVDAARITAPTTLVAAEGDMLVPRDQLVALAGALGSPGLVADLPSVRGHDAFLTEPAVLGRILASALALDGHP